ncbi:MAG: DOMON-like domain-containing protein [Bdellovibrionales bacterium]|nr:DOMON-like domain-containing protein [Bdellovibrionales bacterium]
MPRGTELELAPHPGVPGPVGLRITARLELSAQNLLRAEFFVEGAGVPTLAWPAASASPTRRDELWRRTCFELFWGEAGAESYWEGNFSPSGDWAVYRFDRYRAGMRPEERISALLQPDPPPSATARLWRMECSLDLNRCGAPPLLQLSATCVLETRAGGIHYWALAHTGPKPDFHLRSSFTHCLARGPEETP